jgi:hypothetical protein
VRKFGDALAEPGDFFLLEGLDQVHGLPLVIVSALR